MSADISTWATVFNAMVLQAMPFLVAGVLLSAAVAVLVPQRVWQWVLGRHIAVAIPAAAACGALVPGCECTTVPVADRLTKRGVPFAAAMSFALASPALNPIVVLATIAAFAGPKMAIARFCASFLAVLVVGAYLAASGIVPATRAHDHHHHDAGHGRLSRFVGAARHDLLHTVGLVAVGAGIAAAIRSFVPENVLNRFAGNLPGAVATMAVLAIVMSLCSESDAFVAASFVLFPPMAVLVFMVVGPLVDIRLMLMYRSVFGSKATAAIAGFALLGAVTASVLVGLILL